MTGSTVSIFTIKILLLMLGLSYALYTDVRYGKIPNRLNFTIVITGILLSLFGGRIQLYDSVKGIALPFVICGIPYILGMLGAGDVKLFMALGALMGEEWVLYSMMYSVLIGGVLAFFLMLYRGILFERLRYMFSYFKILFFTGIPSKYEVLDNKKKQFFPFVIAIYFGSIMTFFFKI